MAGVGVGAHLGPPCDGVRRALIRRPRREHQYDLRYRR